jgi:hypothetical protein
MKALATILIAVALVGCGKREGYAPTPPAPRLSTACVSGYVHVVDSYGGSQQQLNEQGGGVRCP